MKKTEKDLCHARLVDRLHYDPLTGAFTWKKRKVRGNKTSAGARNSKGRTQIQLDNILVYAHRLAWFYVYQEWPEEQLDHINLDKSDNRISNLRKASQPQNLANRKIFCKKKTCRLKGVAIIKNVKHGRKYKAIIGNTYLGAFYSEEEAHEAYFQAAVKKYGNFARPD